MKKILVVFGTRPEAIKLAPLVIEAKKDSRFEVHVCSTGQHREMLEPILKFFNITPEFDLKLMKHSQTLAQLSQGVLSGVSDILSAQKYDTVVVQGDTTTAYMAALAAFYNKVPIAHVEAGLRSGDMQSPFPEEFNRKSIAMIAAQHFAPTEGAKKNLLTEGITEKIIFITGNTGIDALLTANAFLGKNSDITSKLDKEFSFLDRSKKLLLITTHRRESFGQPMEEIMKGALTLAKRSDVQILFPVHLNPSVRETAKNIFGNNATWISASSENKDGNNIWLCDPLDYVPFVYLMNRSNLIITDSGGIQEEAPSLGKPVLIAREKTERVEAIESGVAKLIPLNEVPFVSCVNELLDSKEIYSAMAKAQNPFGDGHACAKILDKMAIQKP